MKIPDEAIEAAAKALWEVDISPSDRKYEDCREATRRQIRREVLAALTAAAPHIAAQALRDASDTYPLETAYGGAEHAVNWLRQRAEQFEASVNAGAFLLEDR